MTNQQEYLLSRYLSAAQLLPERLRASALALPESLWARAEEFRVRSGCRMSISVPHGEYAIDEAVEPQDVADLVNIAAQGSLHSHADSLKHGFITAACGHRVGLCGSAVAQDGEVSAIRTFSSANIRIAKEIIGVADEVYITLNEAKKSFPSTLIVSPPGGGKTTLLRDLIRQISDGGVRVAIADERSEIAALSDCEPAFDVGTHTDVLEGASKAVAALMLLRTMNPRVVALDEITDPDDIDAVERLHGCGVSVIATIHGTKVEHGRLYERLKPLFNKVVYIKIENDKRIATVEDMPP